MKLKILLILLCLSIAFSACVHKTDTLTNDGNFPPQIATIMITKCATAGCHNQASYGNADSLLLDSWEHLFNGSSSGAEAIAYSAQFSPLLYFVNTDPSLGTVAVPTMPYSTANRPMAALSKTEYMALYNWIQSGAPDKYGNIPFATNADTRQKTYVTQQGCDLLAVIDAEKNVVMRYIPIGVDPSNIESPHDVKVSPDGNFAYVCFYQGKYLQKINTKTDQVVGSAYLGNLSTVKWSVVNISPDGSQILTTDCDGSGILAAIDANTMTMEPSKLWNASSEGLIYPHGIATNATFDTFFVAAQYSNCVYKLIPNGFGFRSISLDGNKCSSYTDSLNNKPNPHQLLMVPDYSKYFATCQGNNTVVVMDAHTDSILATIPVGIKPQEMALSRSKPYIFVTCTEDGSTNPHAHGSVYVINYNTLQIVAKLYGDFYQPHGISVDDRDGTVTIISENINPDGPAPHHVTSCGGRDGWYTVYNLNTLTPLNNRRYEVTRDPYTADTRFK